MLWGCLNNEAKASVKGMKIAAFTAYRVPFWQTVYETLLLAQEEGLKCVK